MKQLIDKEVARRIISSDRSKEQMLAVLDSVPSVEERKKGEWIAEEDSGFEKCSVCKKLAYCCWNFCPNCEADMRPDYAPLADDDSIYG